LGERIAIGQRLWADYDLQDGVDRIYALGLCRLELEGDVDLNEVGAGRDHQMRPRTRSGHPIDPCVESSGKQVSWKRTPAARSQDVKVSLGASGSVSWFLSYRLDYHARAPSHKALCPACLPCGRDPREPKSLAEWRLRDRLLPLSMIAGQQIPPIAITHGRLRHYVRCTEESGRSQLPPISSQ